MNKEKIFVTILIILLCLAVIMTIYGTIQNKNITEAVEQKCEFKGMEYLRYKWAFSPVVYECLEDGEIKTYKISKEDLLK